MKTLNTPAKILGICILVPSLAVVGIFVYAIGMAAFSDSPTTATTTTDTAATATTTDKSVRDTPEFKANVKKLRDVLRNNNVPVPSDLYDY
jgi:hypothetical protein